MPHKEQICLSLWGFHKLMLSDCEIYSIDENKWYKGPQLNYARANCSACNFDDRFIYIITGKVGTDQPLQFCILKSWIQAWMALQTS